MREANNKHLRHHIARKVNLEGYERRRKAIEAAQRSRGAAPKPTPIKNAADHQARIAHLRKVRASKMSGGCCGR